MMNKLQKENQILEDQLATFTDRILEKTAEKDKVSLAPDHELRRLQKTALRLKNTFHEGGPSEAVIQRMRQNIFLRWKEQESKASDPFWKKFLSMLKPASKKWQSQRSRQRWNVAVALVTVAVLGLISIPLLNKISSNQPAASGQNLNVGVFAATGALVLLAVWLLRRK